MEADISQHSITQAIEEANIDEHRTMSTFQTIAISFAMGCAGGFCNVLTGHPFDTVKVRMQMLQSGLFSTLRNMIREEGLRSLFKGIGSPMCSVPFQHASYFGAYELGKALQGLKHDSKLTLQQNLIAGGFSGIPACLIITPVELVKCKLQMDGVGTRANSISAWKLARNIFKSEGIAGLYKGNLITLMREIPAGASFFASYELFKDWWEGIYGHSAFNPFIVGGFAGLICTIFSYPQDVVKTKLQCDNSCMYRVYLSHPILRDGGIWDCTKAVFRTDGMMGFWRGFTAGALRSVVTEAVTWLVYVHGKNEFM